MHMYWWWWQIWNCTSSGISMSVPLQWSLHGCIRFMPFTFTFKFLPKRLVRNALHRCAERVVWSVDDDSVQSESSTLYRGIDISSFDTSEGGGIKSHSRGIFNFIRPHNIWTAVGCNFLHIALKGLANPDDCTALIPYNNHSSQLSEMIERHPMALVSAISAIDEAALLGQTFDPVQSAHNRYI